MAVAGAVLGRLAGADRAARLYDLYLAVLTLLFLYGLGRAVASFS